MIEENGIYRRRGGLINPCHHYDKRPRIMAGGNYMLGFGGGAGTGITFTDPHLNAVDLDGSTEYLAKTSEQTLGFGDTFTIGFWFNVDNASGTNSLMVLDPDASNNSRITVQLIDIQTTQGFRVELFDSSGTLTKSWKKDGEYSASTNTHVFVTWTGNTTLNAYFDGGAAVASWIKNTDITGTLADDARRIYIGAGVGGGSLFSGNLCAVSIWNVSLDSNNRTAVYNGAGGSGTGFKDNLTSNFGNYDQSANLVQQWKLGNSSVDANIGHSFVTSGGVNVSDNAVGVTSADVVSF